MQSMIASNVITRVNAVKHLVFINDKSVQEEFLLQKDGLLAHASNGVIRSVGVQPGTELQTYNKAKDFLVSNSIKFAELK